MCFILKKHPPDIQSWDPASTRVLAILSALSIWPCSWEWSSCSHAWLMPLSCRLPNFCVSQKKAIKTYQLWNKEWQIIFLVTLAANAWLSIHPSENIRKHPILPALLIASHSPGNIIRMGSQMTCKFRSKSMDHRIQYTSLGSNMSVLLGSQHQFRRRCRRRRTSPRVTYRCHSLKSISPIHFEMYIKKLYVWSMKGPIPQSHMSAAPSSPEKTHTCSTKTLQSLETPFNKKARWN